MHTLQIPRLQKRKRKSQLFRIKLVYSVLTEKIPSERTHRKTKASRYWQVYKVLSLIIRVPSRQPIYGQIYLKEHMLLR